MLADAGELARDKLTGGGLTGGGKERTLINRAAESIACL